MQILWRLQRASVQDVLDALPAGRVLARTSVSTMLRILEAKEVLTSEKTGRAHVYIPRLSKAEYESRSLQHMVSRVFDGDAKSLLLRLVDTDDLDLAELDAVRAILKKKGART
jgi:predicted transcriptional regulator